MTHLPLFLFWFFVHYFFILKCWGYSTLSDWISSFWLNGLWWLIMLMTGFNIGLIIVDALFVFKIFFSWVKIRIIIAVTIIYLLIFNDGIILYKSMGQSRAGIHFLCFENFRKNIRYNWPCCWIWQLICFSVALCWCMCWTSVPFVESIALCFCQDRWVFALGAF